MPLRREHSQTVQNPPSGSSGSGDLVDDIGLLSDRPSTPIQSSSSISGGEEETSSSQEEEISERSIFDYIRDYVPYTTAGIGVARMGSGLVEIIVKPSVALSTVNTCLSSIYLISNVFPGYSLYKEYKDPANVKLSDVNDIHLTEQTRLSDRDWCKLKT